MAAADQKAAEESVAAREVIALAESLELELELAVAKKADEDAMATTVETDLEIQPEAYLGGTVPIVDPAELKPSAAARLWRAQQSPADAAVGVSAAASTPCAHAPVGVAAHTAACNAVSAPAGDPTAPAADTTRGSHRQRRHARAVFSKSARTAAA